MSELLDLALQAHGGLERWSGVQSLDVHVSLTGGLYLIKGYPEGVPNVTMRIDARRPAVIISPYARPDHRGYFTPDRVWIEDRAGRVIDEREHPRDSFAGHVLETPWDQLHRLYFTSYAMWNYLTTPFLFTQPGFKQKENEPHQENDETWRCLHVRFPPDIPTHNNFQTGGEQTFFSTIRDSCMGSTIWPSARPRTIASTTRISRESSSQPFGESSHDPRPDRRERPDCGMIQITDVVVA